MCLGLSLLLPTTKARPRPGFDDHLGPTLSGASRAADTTVFLEVSWGLGTSSGVGLRYWLSDDCRVICMFASLSPRVGTCWRQVSYVWQLC